MMTGLGPLYAELRRVFASDYPPNAVHQLLAAIPRIVHQKGYPPHYPLIVTTNFDDLLERAYVQEAAPFEVVTYIAEGEDRGRFVHRMAGGEIRLIERPNEYREFSLDRCPVILKMHGAVDPMDPERDSFVITEDQFIDYLTRADFANLVPVTLAAKLRRSPFLFLGYGLRDWSMRVVLHRIWGEQRLVYKSWAVPLNPQPNDQEFWRNRDVDLLDVRLEDYIAALNDQLQALPPAGGGT